MGFFRKLFGLETNPDDFTEISADELTPVDDIPAMEGEACFEVDDVFSITGRGTVAVGFVRKGTFSEGDIVTVNGCKTEIMSVEQFRKFCKAVSEGENAGLLLKGIAKNQLVKGDYITK